MLATHAPALVAKLEDSNKDVRQGVMKTLGRLEPAVLATHAPALVAKLEAHTGTAVGLAVLAPVAVSARKLASAGSRRLSLYNVKRG